MYTAVSLADNLHIEHEVRTAICLLINIKKCMLHSAGCCSLWPTASLAGALQATSPTSSSTSMYGCTTRRRLIESGSARQFHLHLRLNTAIAGSYWREVKSQSKWSLQLIGVPVQQLLASWCCLQELHMLPAAIPAAAFAHCVLLSGNGKQPRAS
jgi:hypothetical protein